MSAFEPYKLTGLVLGFSITQDLGSLLFRAHRVLANSYESAAILILFALFGMLSSANPAWLNGCALAYLVGRVGHMMFYYGNLKIARSVAFAISFCALLGMFNTGLVS